MPLGEPGRVQSSLSTPSRQARTFWCSRSTKAIEPSASTTGPSGNPRPRTCTVGFDTIRLLHARLQPGVLLAKGKTPDYAMAWEFPAGDQLHRRQAAFSRSLITYKMSA